MVGSRATYTDLREELADVVISATLIANYLDEDLGEIIKEKFNKTSQKYSLKTTLSIEPNKDGGKVRSVVCAFKRC